MSAVTSYVKSTRQALVNEVLDSIKSGEPLFWSNKMNFINGRNRNAKTDRPYRGVNMLYLYVANLKHEKETGNFYNDNRWMTFHQIQEKNYKLRKGAKGSPIEFFEMKKYEIDKYIAYLEANKFPSKAIENAKKFKSEGLTEIIKPVVKIYRVFNGEDIEGLPQLTFDANLDLEKKHQDMENMIKNSEAKIEYLGHRPDQAFSNYYAPGNDSIMLANPEYFKDMAGFYATAAHEIGHSTGHQDRLNRTGITQSTGFGTPEYAKEELRAELVSMFIGQDYGIGIDEQHKNNHKAYFQGWIQALQNDPDELVKAATEAEKAVDYIKDHMINRTKELELYNNIRPILNEYNATESIDVKFTIDNNLQPILSSIEEQGNKYSCEKNGNTITSVTINNKTWKANEKGHFGFNYEQKQESKTQTNTRARLPGQGLEPKTQSRSRNNSLQM